MTHSQSHRSNLVTIHVPRAVTLRQGHGSNIWLKLRTLGRPIAARSGRSAVGLLSFLSARSGQPQAGYNNRTQPGVCGPPPISEAGHVTMSKAPLLCVGASETTSLGKLGDENLYSRSCLAF